MNPEMIYTQQAFVLFMEGIKAALFVEEAETEIHLFTNDIQPDQSIPISGFTEATFTGYTLKEVYPMSAPAQNDQGLIVCQSELIRWDAAAGAEPQTVHGAYITTVQDNTYPLVSFRFAEPQVMGGPLPTTIAGVYRFSVPLSPYGWIDVEQY